MCPRHDQIQHCPLYVAGHGGGGCVDDMARPCRVARGAMDYRAEVETLRVCRPGVVERCSFAEDADRIRAQRVRNMRQAGVH